jgi:hypothetical protein
MVIHTFILRWKPQATQAHKDRALAEVLAFQGQVPGLLETYAGPNFSTHSQGHDFGAVMKLSDRAALDAYAISPIHQQLLAWLAPLVEPIDVDFEI